MEQASTTGHHTSCSEFRNVAVIDPLYTLGSASCEQSADTHCYCFVLQGNAAGSASTGNVVSSSDAKALTANTPCKFKLLLNHVNWHSYDPDIRAQELCESRGSRPGLPFVISLWFLWT